MYYEIVELQEFSGLKCSIYTVIPKGNSVSLYRGFLDENNLNHPDEIIDIQKRLYEIGHFYGARESFFKLFEGNPGDQVCALFDLPEKNLRLYCIRFGMDLVILGGGGFKSKTIRSYQEDPRLKAKAEQMKQLAKHIGDRLVKQEDLRWSLDKIHLEGDLKNFNDEEDK